MSLPSLVVAASTVLPPTGRARVDSSNGSPGFLLTTLSSLFVMDPTDPLRAIEKEDTEDLFKSLNGSAGVIKITSDSDSQPGE